MLALIVHLLCRCLANRGIQPNPFPLVQLPQRGAPIVLVPSVIRLPTRCPCSFVTETKFAAVPPCQALGGTKTVPDMCLPTAQLSPDLCMWLRRR
jgi:hypothetical protein